MLSKRLVFMGLLVRATVGALGQTTPELVYEFLGGGTGFYPVPPAPALPASGILNPEIPDPGFYHPRPATLGQIGMEAKVGEEEGRGEAGGSSSEARFRQAPWSWAAQLQGSSEGSWGVGLFWGPFQIDGEFDRLQARGGGMAFTNSWEGVDLGVSARFPNEGSPLLHSVATFPWWWGFFDLGGRLSREGGAIRFGSRVLQAPGRGGVALTLGNTEPLSVEVAMGTGWAALPWDALGQIVVRPGAGLSVVNLRVGWKEGEWTLASGVGFTSGSGEVELFGSGGWALPFQATLQSGGSVVFPLGRSFKFWVRTAWGGGEVSVALQWGSVASPGQDAHYQGELTLRW